MNPSPQESAPLDPQLATNMQTFQTMQWMLQEQQRIQLANMQVSKAFTNVISPFVVGNQSMQDLRTSNNVFDRLLGNALPMFGAAVAEMTGFGGGSTMGAMQNMFGYGNMRVRDQSGAMLPMNGYGYGADMLANQFFSQVQSSIWNQNGSVNLRNTYGLMPQDVGETLNAINRRGAFNGTVAGTMETLTPSRMMELRNQAIDTGNQRMLDDLQSLKPGDNYVSLDPSVAGKVSRWQDEALRTVSELKQIFGNLKPEVLLGELERLTGVDVGRPGQLRVGAASLQNIINRGAAAGMSAQEALQFHAASASTFDAMMANRTGMPQGSFMRSAASMANVIDAYALPAYAEGVANGGFRSRGEVATRKAADMASALTQSPELLEAAWYAASFGADSEQGAALLQGMNAFNSAGSPEAQAAARRNLAALIQKNVGTRTGAAIDIYGADSMMDYIATKDPRIAGMLGKTLAQYDQAAMVGDFRQMLGTFTSASKYMGGLDAGASALHSLYTTLTPEQRDAMLAGDYGKLKGVTAPGIGDVGDYLNGLKGKMGDSQLKGMLTAINAGVITNPNMSGMVTGAAQAEADAASGKVAADKTDVRGRSTLGFMDKLLQTALGGQLPENDRIMMDYAEGIEKSGEGGLVSRYRINDKLGLSVNADQAKRLAGTLAGGGANLYREFGINPKDPDAAAKLAKALSGSGAAGRVAELIGMDPGQIVGMSTGENGSTLNIANDPGELRKRYEDELNQIRNPGKQANMEGKQAAKGNQVTPMAGALSITINDPKGTFRSGGTFTIKPETSP